MLKPVLQTILSCVICLPWVVMSVQAGSLAEFEKEIDKPAGPVAPGVVGRPAAERRPEVTEKAGNIWAEMFLSPACLQLGFPVLVTGGANTAARTFEYSESSEGDEYLTLRETGEPLVPLIRFEGDKFLPEDDILALSLNAEVGIAFVGISYQQVYFEETLPDGAKTDLTVSRFMGMYRMSFGNAVEVDLAAGSVTADGAKVNDMGFAFSTPVRVHPWKHFGIEFRPAWGRIEDALVEDYETTILMTYGMTSLKAGYRWFGANDEAINGPSLGIAVRL